MMPNLQLRRILCPIDFSRRSAAALRLAGGLAQSLGAELVVLHAQRVEAPMYFTAAQTKALQAQLKRAARAGREFAAKFAATHLPKDISRRVVLVEGDPVAAVLRAVKSMRAAMIVMGTHGRTGLERIRLGSVAESILRQASVPVLTVGPQVTSSGSSGRFEKILCPVNFGHLARAACEFAAGLAERTGAELIVTHVVEGEQPSPERALRELCDWIGPDIRRRCRVNEVVREGSAAEQIIALARESKADLVVAGARPRSLLGAVLFGSTSESLIRTAPCPVLSVIQK